MDADSSDDEHGNYTTIDTLVSPDDDGSEKGTQSSAEEDSAQGGADEGSLGQADEDSHPADCAICLATPRLPCRTQCGHVYCRACTVRSFMRQAPWTISQCPLCRSTVTVYSTIDLGTGLPLRTPPVTTIFGCVFPQQGSVGVASYHFDSPQACYISYANAPEAWKLADGSSPPARKDFEEAVYDARTRTFTGIISWEDNPFGDDARWDYVMRFSEDFGIIDGGCIKATKADGSRGQTSRFPMHLRYWRLTAPQSISGCAFVQFGLLGMASYHFEDGIECAHMSYASAPEQWRLDDGSSPPITKPFEPPQYDEDARTFTGTISWAEPATFGGDTRWEYKMVFSQDFRTIESGHVHSFNKSEECTAIKRFNRDLAYRRYDECRAQMLRALRSEPSPLLESETDSDDSDEQGVPTPQLVTNHSDTGPGYSGRGEGADSVHAAAEDGASDGDGFEDEEDVFSVPSLIDARSDDSDSSDDSVGDRSASYRFGSVHEDHQGEEAEEERQSALSSPARLASLMSTAGFRFIQDSVLVQDAEAQEDLSTILALTTDTIDSEEEQDDDTDHD